MFPGLMNSMMMGTDKDPTLVNQSSVAADTGSTSRSITLPSGIIADDTIYVFSSTHATSVTFSAPSGFSILAQNNTASFTCALFQKIAVGNESSTSISWNTSASTSFSSAVSAVVRGAFFGSNVVAGSNVTTIGYDFPNNTAPWGTAVNLFLLFCRNGSGVAGRTFTAPTGYTKNIEASAGGCTSTLCTKKVLSGASDDPASANWSAAGNESGFIVVC